MALTSARLTSAEYDRLYGNEPGWEYWFGEARRKSMPTYLHGVLQLLLGHLLFLAGYGAASETEIRVDPEWHPRPDIAGILRTEVEDYPTAPVDVAFEILSEGEAVEDKCEHYARIGIPQVFVFHGEIKQIRRWDPDAKTLIVVEDVELLNGVVITGRTIWSELDRRMSERQATGRRI
jgi:Uma2 family endonuclease